MFNILTDELPKTVNVGGQEYDVRWWFRTMIRIETVLHDVELEMSERRAIALALFYPEIPEDVEEAERQMLDFYASDKPRNEKQQTDVKRHANDPPTYSFDYDDEYIYAAFRQQYGINLNTVEALHWFEFRAMLIALDNCVFNTIKGYRATDLSKIKDAATRKHYKELKDYWKIPVPQEMEDADELGDILMHGGDLEAYKRRRREHG
ncbi:bacteriophage Gp15 family protein [Eubacteriales bacterium OttesenSCG-928-N13]|nr:bacteriophage Gp15 family protein [Eubacteriales bacterium OttesenSCG-928-N13]